MSLRSQAEVTSYQSKVAERYAHLFDRPEVRLRFLSNTLTLQTKSAARLNVLLTRFGFLQRISGSAKLYDWLLDFMLYRLIVQELSKLLPATARERMALLRRNKAPLAARVFFGFYQLRHGFYGAGFALGAVALFGLYTAAVWSTHRANDFLAHRYGKNVPVNMRGGGGPGVAYAQTTQHLPDYRADKVWLVAREAASERYSNGGRISTEFEIDNHMRGYYVLPHNANLAQPLPPLPAAAPLRRAPIGIVYHTSESELVGFTPANNDSIEAHTRGLLQFVQRNRSYNYLIDRFGQVYRIVRDEQAANHAGHSVWADQQGVYVGLNESFIGVCFETRSDAQEEEQLTEAQLVAGRLLTQILRSRYQIDDANCVTHGLVSVNPDNMRICYHHDWARNFPFEAMGLSDKYQVAPVSISEFGFTYDDDIVAMLGGAIWPGAQAAATEFDRRATAADLTPDALRRQVRARYRQQMDNSRRLRAAAAPSESEPRTDGAD